METKYNNSQSGRSTDLITVGSQQLEVTGVDIQGTAIHPDDECCAANRITINYIRHELVSYHVDKNYQIDRFKAEEIITEKIHEEIEKVYPHLFE